MRLNTRVFASTVARRTFTLFVLCALLPVCGLAILAFWQVTSELNEQSQRRLQQSSKAVAIILFNRLLAAERALEAAADRADGPVTREARRPFKGLSLTTGDGTDRPLFGAVAPPSFSPAQRAHLSAGKTVLSAEPGGDGRARLIVSRALDRARPEHGILHGSVDPADFWTVEDETALPAGSKLIVLDETGRVLFSSFDSTLTLPKAVTRYAGERVAGHFEWDNGTDEYIATHWSLFLLSSFSTPKWTIVLNQAKADVFAPIASFKRTFFLVVLLTVWMVLLLSVRQIRRGLTPLERLQEGTRRLAQGDLDTRVEVTSHDEFQDLAASFNRMAGQLGRQFKALEMRREISAALNPTRPTDDVLQACGHILTGHLKLAALGVWVVGGDDTTLELRARVQAFSPPAERPGILLGDLELQGLARERRPYVSNAVGEDSRLGGLEWAVEAGIVAFVGHPLIVDERRVGFAAAFATRPLDDLDLNGFAAAAGDIARYIDRKRVEDALHESELQLRQLQKMEAVGRLAGGIAHDFNNLLTVILGRSRLLLAAMEADHPHRRSIKSIDQTAERAAMLTRQLLAFSRKQVLAPTVLDLNEVVVGTMDILQRLIGESVELTFNPDPDVGRVKVDRGQLEQVIVNLVVNARDAMPEGGRITIATSAAGLDESAASATGSARQANLSVTDTGTGMDAHTQARIFEPFFTTKEPGKGTGLGLATVYGILRQSGGTIKVDSELGAGTTFTISLPQVEDRAEATETPSAPPRRGTETVLVVEDEAEVRALVHSVLADHGYLVLSAGRPSEAVDLAERHPGPIHLLVTDMVMPEMGGASLARQLIAVRSEMAVLYMSGYTDSTVGEGSLFLQKPFTPDTIARSVRAALDAVTRTAVSAAP
jgi:signal transduction histidine kinase/HAMP domain-containing protein/ActR/RegA family two-component response regulator